jgi:ubiquinone/menaquinone biosynthesis C-methylase UbiE
LKKRHISLEKKLIMDAGCGSGYSTELIAHEFHPSRIIAFDYMPEQINLAKKRELRVDFSTGDLTQIESADNTCDAVFIFGVLHHIPEWRAAVCEVFRVLKPGGVLLVDEPRARFNWLEFESGIRQAGMNILEVRNIFFTLLRGYLCQKPI